MTSTQEAKSEQNTLRGQWLPYVDQLSRKPKGKEAAGPYRYLSAMAAVCFTGRDALSFLQGYLTCDTQTLSVGRLQACAVCDLKGRVVANGWCFLEHATDSEQSLTFIVHRSLATAVADYFQRYILFSKTELQNAADSVLVFASLGTPRDHALSIDADHHLYLMRELASAKVLYQRASAEVDWDQSLIQAHIAIVSQATTGQFLPQMLGLDRLGAVSFDKGCYLGQEVVARAQHRGRVKRTLQRLNWRGPTPQPGANLVNAAEKNVGTVVNVAATAVGSGVCLAVIANETDGPYRHGDTVLTP